MLLAINQLTSDEDKRQDLWVAYLSGAPQDLLPTFQANQDIENSFPQAIHQLILNPPPQYFIDYLTETECVIVCLLMLGCDLSMISRYNGINEVRVRQIVVALKDSKAREKLWPSKDLSMMKNDSD